MILIEFTHIGSITGRHPHRHIYNIESLGYATLLTYIYDLNCSFSFANLTHNMGLKTTGKELIFFQMANPMRICMVFCVSGLC